MENLAAGCLTGSDLGAKAAVRPEQLRIAVTQICMQISRHSDRAGMGTTDCVLPLQVTEEVMFHKNYPAFYCIYLLI